MGCIGSVLQYHASQVTARSVLWFALLISLPVSVGAVPLETVSQAERVEVSGFGADPSSSAESNTLALQSAIDSGAAVVDLGGRSYLSNQLKLRSDLVLTNGTLVMSGAANFNYGALLWADGKENITLKQITLLQGSEVPTSLVRRGVVFRNCVNFAIIKSTFNNWNDQAIRIESSHDFEVMGNSLNNCNRNSINTSSDASDDYGAIALFIACSDGKIGLNDINGGGTGISIFGGKVTDTANNIEIYNNNLSGNEKNVSGMGIYCLKNISNVSITGNSIKDYFNEGIVIINTTTSQIFTVENVLIGNNFVENNKYAQINLQKGGAAQIFRNVTVADNTIIGPDSSTRGGHGIIVNNDSQLGDFTNLTITKNTISTTQTNSTPFALWLQRSTGSIISDNSISGSWDRQVWDDRQSGASFSGNDLHVASGKTGLLVNSSAKSAIPNRYQDNNFRGTDATSILVSLAGPDKLGGASFVGNTLRAGIIDPALARKPIVDSNLLHEVSTMGSAPMGLKP